MDNYEEKLIRLVNDQNLQAVIFNPWTHGYQDFNNFKYVNELTDIEFEKDEIRQEQNQKNADQLQFFRTVIIRHNRKPVASGSIVISQE